MKTTIIPVKVWMVVRVIVPLIGPMWLPRRVTVSYRYFVDGHEVDLHGRRLA